MDKNDTNTIETNTIETNTIETNTIETDTIETNTIETNTEIIYCDNEPDIKTIQKIVEGYFTIIPLIDNKLMYVNEEGELISLPINISASNIVGYNIYGNVLIVG